MYIVEFTKTAEKDFFKLEKTLQERIVAVLERIKVRPEHFLLPLSGRSEYKLRFGDYRLIIDIQKNKLLLLVIKVGYRKNIYD